MRGRDHHSWREWLYSNYYFLPPLIALLVVAPVAWMLFIDRAPPLVLYDGHLVPDKVYPGQVNVQVLWRARFAGRDCGGYSQRELVDAQANLWPKLTQPRAGIFHPSPGNPMDGTVTTPPLEIPPQMTLGPARYRVTQFYYCNWLQRWLDMPIVQTSVAIELEVVER